MGLGGQRHVPAALPMGKTRYPLYRRLGGPQGRSGRVRKISPPHRDSMYRNCVPHRERGPCSLQKPVLMLFDEHGEGLGRLRLKCDGTRTDTRFSLSAKWTSPFKSAGASVQSTTGSRGVRICGSNVGYTVFRGSVRVMATHSIHQFPLHFPSRASPCAIRFQLDSTTLRSNA
jgi:hypothetical protein